MMKWIGSKIGILVLYLSYSALEVAIVITMLVLVEELMDKCDNPTILGIHALRP